MGTSNDLEATVNDSFPLSCNITISEVASTNRFEVLFVDFGYFTFVVASRFEI